MNRADFLSYFKRDFWKALSSGTFPIEIPKTGAEKLKLLESVYEDISSSRYSPDGPEVELVENKGLGVARSIPVFSVRDYCVYYFCIKELEEILCHDRTPNTFGGWRLGGKLRKLENDEIENESGEYGRYSFNPFAWSQAFGDFNSKLFSQLIQGNYKYILQLDLANFYDSVRLDILENLIREKSPPEKGPVITLMFHFLNHWNHGKIGTHPQVVGLPQDALADCSRILANFYLQQYDEFTAGICTQADAVYFRYADDQMILLNDKSKIENLLLLVTRDLDTYGLRVNQKKVIVWETSDLIKHRCLEIQKIFVTKNDRYNPTLVLKFVESYLVMTPEELDCTWNNGIPLLNRLIWAKLDSLPHALTNELIVRFTSDSYLLRASAKQMLLIRNIILKCSSPVNLNIRIRAIANQSVHNIFHYEARYFAQEIKDKALWDFLQQRIDHLSEIMKLNIIE